MINFENYTLKSFIIHIYAAIDRNGNAKCQARVYLFSIFYFHSHANSSCEAFDNKNQDNKTRKKNPVNKRETKSCESI